MARRGAGEHMRLTNAVRPPCLQAGGKALTRPDMAYMACREAYATVIW